MGTLHLEINMAGHLKRIRAYGNRENERVMNENIEDIIEES
jgi:hypothetical protein